MQQQKTGALIRALRKEKQLTQEQLAAQFGVSRRTVSRWETGSNLPDWPLLIELADYFAVDLRALLDGERKEPRMDKELQQAVLQAADYGEQTRQALQRRMHRLFLCGVAAAALYTALLFTGNEQNFWGGLCVGIMAGLTVVGALMTSCHAARLRALKIKLLRRR